MADSTIEKRLENILGLEDNLDDLAMDFEPEQQKSKELVPVETVEYEDVESKVEGNDDAVEDYKYSRKIVYGLIERGTTVLEDALRISRESESPRAIEVANGLMKNISELTKDLMDLHKSQKELAKKESGEGGGTTNNTQNNYYLGDTSSMGSAMKELEGLMDKDEDCVDAEVEEVD